MYNISFGKITPQAEQTARLHIQGMQMAADIFKDESTYQKVNEAKSALERAKNDPNYLFDNNPDQIAAVDENGQPKFNDNNSYTIYKTAEGNDKYLYLGKCELLSDGYKLTDKIDLVIQHHKEEGNRFPGAYRHIGVALCNADKTIGREAAMETAKKILDING